MCPYPSTPIPWPQFPNHFARVNNCWCVVTPGHSQRRNVIKAFISDRLGSCLPADTCSSGPLRWCLYPPDPSPSEARELGLEWSCSCADAGVAFLCVLPRTEGEGRTSSSRGLGAQPLTRHLIVCARSFMTVSGSDLSPETCSVPHLFGLLSTTWPPLLFQR